ncbi:MAG: hypothetical protein HCA25_07530 [Dolichospermum sp. DET50]|nr:hypothetical protein [Dolichospermum sp. DET66]MBS3032137.1 hypothetical protein [Dolichospermum sp. DET67]MBS3037341.1 hypothetical protein [Dolichospermum sp. DET50]QSX69330.1 MAG: hypothetical protein EZY12_06750 [Dolichospermum sp. DET69]
MIPTERFAIAPHIQTANCLQQRFAIAPPHPKQRSPIPHIPKKRSPIPTPSTSDRTPTSQKSDRIPHIQKAIALHIPKSDRPSTSPKAIAPPHPQKNDRTPTSQKSDSYGALRYRTS